MRVAAFAKRTLVLSSILAAVGGRADAQSFNQFVGFGDSTIDSGFYRALPFPAPARAVNNLWPTAVAHGAGKPTSSPGLMNSEALAAMFGLTAIPSNQPGGTNYATSGAKNVTVNSNADRRISRGDPDRQPDRQLPRRQWRAAPTAMRSTS